MPIYKAHKFSQILSFISFFFLALKSQIYNMDSTTTPPYHRSNAKSASRLDRSQQNLSLDLVLQSNDTPVSIRSSSSSRVLLLSPSPLRKSKTRLADRLEMASEDAADPNAPVRKRGKAKGGQKGLLASPRNPRRSRRRSEAVEDKDANAVVDEIAKKPRKRKTNGRPNKEKQNSAPLSTSPCSSSHLPSTHSLSSFFLSMCVILFLSSPVRYSACVCVLIWCSGEDACQSDLNRIGEIISDLVMWRHVAKSTLCFGFGSLCFLSSCFSKGFNFRYITTNYPLNLKKKTKRGKLNS